MENDAQPSGPAPQKTEKASPVKVILSWVGAATAVLGLIGSLSGWFHTFDTHRKQRAELIAKMAVAQGQLKQGEYRASVRSFGEILKTDPLYSPALEGQLDAVMLWVENFQVLGPRCWICSIERIEGRRCAGASGVGALAQLAYC